MLRAWREVSPPALTIADSPSEFFMTADASGTSMFVNFERRDAVLIGHVVGPNIGQREAGIITEAFEGAMETISGINILQVDLSDIAFMNSMGIGMLVDLRNRTSARRLTLILSDVKPELEQLLKMVRLDKLFTICTNEKQLAKAIKKG